jgi:hypothetical protein
MIVILLIICLTVVSLITGGKEIVDMCLDCIGKLPGNWSLLSRTCLQRCCHVGGGTGSGLGSLLVELLYVNCDMNSKLGLTVFPHSLLEDTDLLVIDNEAIYNICRWSHDSERPTYIGLCLRYIILFLSSSRFLYYVWWVPKACSACFYLNILHIFTHWRLLEI